MKANIPKPVHESYLKHRRQFVWQIILPVALTALLFVAMIVLINVATFRDQGDVGRWAAISTIWIVMPIMIAGVIFLVVLTGLVYLLMRLLQITPVYTGQAQDFVYKLAGYIKRTADALVKPIFFIDGVGASVRAFFGKK